MTVDAVLASAYFTRKPLHGSAPKLELQNNNNKMENLITALQILLKYANKEDEFPTNCSHDVLTVCCGIDDISKVSEEDVKKLDDLGFFWSEDAEHFQSYKFGSC